MRAEVINTGSELLLGQVVNTHLAYLGEQLFTLGFRIGRQLAIPDGAEILQALEESFARKPDVLFVTGGLGPTTDDITRDLLADWLGVKLILHPESLRLIEERFAKRGFVMNERIARQAYVPEGVQPMLNDWGTAPGLYLPAGEKWPATFFLPGPPRELRPMFRERVTPLLRDLFPVAGDVQCQVYRVVGLGESMVEERVGARLLALPGLELGYCARSGEVDLRVVGGVDTIALAGAIIEEALAANIYARNEGTMEQSVVELLRGKKRTLATAESCTGGFLAHRITNVPGASEIFPAGFVSYANAIKTSELGVGPALLAEHGAVSEAVAGAMAAGARGQTGTDYALSTTGIAGPGGGSPEKPVGTVFIGLATSGEVSVSKHFFPTDRETFKYLVSQTALNRLREALLENG